MGRYSTFRLCREMGWTLEQYEAQPLMWLRDCFMFLAAERDAQETLRKRAER